MDGHAAQTHRCGPRTWQVLLLGGASGVGKTSVSYRLAQHLGVGLTEVDDFQVVLEGMTTPEQQPVLHHWRTHPEELRLMNDEQRLAYILQYSAVLAGSLELVIANHLEARRPLVLEGDFILPSLAVRPFYGDIAAGGEVRGIFLHEGDEAQFSRNYLLREGEEQLERARGSWRHSAWLRQEAERLGLPVIAARPWDTVLARCIAAVEAFAQPALL
jgi:2-phosphoglycerate kinase